MVLYIVRRTLWAAVVVLIVLLLTYAVFYLLPAGDPALRFAGKSPTPESLALIRHRLGLDQSWYVQYGRFVKNFVTGDEFGWPGLGYSYVNGAYPVIQTTSKNIPISTRPRWFKDYADASTFIDPLFKGANMIPSGNTNYALVGLKPSQVKELGVTGSTKNVPSIDKASEICGKLTGNARLSCYALIDKTLMEKIVPWVPYMSAKTVTILGPKVTKWNFDQNAGFTALAHVAVSK